MFALSLRLNIQDRDIEDEEVSPKAEGHNNRQTFVEDRVFSNPINRLMITERELDGEISPKAEGENSRKAIDSSMFAHGQIVNIDLKSEKN
jgi:hypothetical protein